LNPLVNFRLAILAALLLGACAGPPQPLVVKQFLLRDQVDRASDEPMVRMEKARRLLGAVSMEERRLRLGQYYTLLWNDPDGVGKGEVEVTFQYQQGASASRIKQITRKFPATQSAGQTEFSIIGDDYFKDGKVLAWKASLRRGQKIIATQQSYLWE
jgi:hypothetical protein